jgi:hypothetical protein
MMRNGLAGTRLWFGWNTYPARQLFSPSADRSLPPLTEEHSPLASSARPTLTEAE